MNGKEIKAVVIMSAVAAVFAAFPASATMPSAEMPKPFPVDLDGTLLAQHASDPFAAIDGGVSQTESDTAFDYMADLVGPLVGDISVPCEPGKIRAESRVALGEMLKWTPADLRGTNYRAPWFQAFPQTRSFPAAADASAILYRYGVMGTVSKVRSTSAWPIWYNPGQPPTNDEERAATARLFMGQNADLILYNPDIDVLEVMEVITDDQGDWTVYFVQTYQ